MMVEPGRPALVGWAALGGTVAVVLLALWVIADHGAAEQALATSRRNIKSERNGEPIEQRQAAERDAVSELHKTINELKARTGFTVLKQFQVPIDDQDEKLRQPGYFFKQRLVAVRDGVRRKAKLKSIEFDESLGFDTSDMVPPDADAAFLLTMLQLTDKAAHIVLDTPHPVSRFDFARLNNTNKAIETGPLDRPVLLREYPLELKVVGGLEDLLWILHRLSQVDPDQTGDYPLILQGLTIDSQNLTQRDEINQLTATFRIAGMQFLSDAERAKLSGTPLPTGAGNSNSNSSGGDARPRPQTPSDPSRPRA